MVSPRKNLGWSLHQLSIFDLTELGPLQAAPLPKGCSSRGDRERGKEAAHPGQLAGLGEGVTKRALTWGQSFDPTALILRPLSTSHLKQAFPRGGGGLSPCLLRGRSRSCPVLDLLSPYPHQLLDRARDALANAPPREPGAEAARPAGPAWRGQAGQGAPHSPIEEAWGGRERGRGWGRCGSARGRARWRRGWGRAPAECSGRGRSAAAEGPSAVRGGAGQVGGGRSGVAAPAYGADPAPRPRALLPAPRWAEPAPGGSISREDAGSPSPL